MQDRKNLEGVLIEVFPLISQGERADVTVEWRLQSVNEYLTQATYIGYFNGHEGLMKVNRPHSDYGWSFETATYKFARMKSCERKFVFLAIGVLESIV